MSQIHNKVAIVLGGTDDHIYLIEKLKARGYHTILIDYLENPPASQSADIFIRENALDKDKVLNIAQREKADIVIATCIDQALLVMAYVCEMMHLPCHLTYQEALSLTNKAFMKKIFIQNQIPSSRFVVLENQTNYGDLISELQFPLVVKPSDANSSKGVVKVFNMSDLPIAINNAFSISTSKKIILEEYFEGTELSVDVIIQNHKAEILLISRNHKIKHNKTNFTIVQNSFNIADYQRYAGLLKPIAEKIACAFKLNNVPLLIQVLVKDDQISVIEFSSRIGGGSKHLFIKKITGFDLLEYFVNIIERNSQGVINHGLTGHFFYDFASVNYIYTKPGVIKAVEGISELLASKCIYDFAYYKTLFSRIDYSLASSDRVGSFFIVANTLEEHRSKCIEADATLKVINADEGADIMLHGLFSNII